MILQSFTNLNYRPVRIVSLVPSQTELLHWLGLEKETVAITKFCVHPADWSQSKLIIGGTKNIDNGKIKSLRPDLIIANKEENVQEQVEELAKGYPVWLTDIANFNDALQMIKDIGYLTHSSKEAGALIQNIVANFLILSPRETISTAYLVWRKPFITVGGDTFINDMMSRCGLRNIFAHKTRYPTITITALKEAGCRLLLLSSEPYPFTQHHIDELQLLLPDTKMVLVDGEMFSWYGSRLLLAPSYFRKLMIEIDFGGDK